MTNQWAPAPIFGGTYQDDTRPYSFQDCVNYLPEVADVSGGRSNSILRGLPGMVDFADVGDGPIRGVHDVEGNLYVVSGTGLFHIAADGTVSSSLGTIPGSQRVGMQHNQITGGNELAIGNGPSGYVYNTVTATFTAITDPGFPGTWGFWYVDSYLAGVEPLGRYWFHSNLAAATDYNTLDQYQAESAPDLILALIVNHREVWALGQRTIEPFDNTGAAVGTFQRANGIVIEQGVASRWGAANLDNTVFFFGNDGIFYRANGYTPQRISTHAIEQAILGLDWSQAYAFTWTDRGHKVVYWTFPDGHTWGYDVATNLWHRRESYGLRRWRANHLVWWNNQWIAGDYQLGKLYTLDWDVYQEGDDPLVAERITGNLSNNQNWTIVDGVQLVMDTGRTATNDHSVEICYSDDGGYNFTKWRSKSLGARGQYVRQIQFNRLGRTRNRIWKVRVASPCKRDLIAAAVKLVPTAS